MNNLVEKIKEEGHKKGLVESGDTGHLALWNMLCEQLPQESFCDQDDTVWLDIMHAPIVKTA